ncbi:hypothetical protein CRUP_002171 [Coryphaenoides rupestris]|nr:hypothetical protein CRUP_002171 [Coryphaenoides rupestris]
MDVKDISAGFRALFYMVTPNESCFERVDDVPPYTNQVGRPPAVRTGRRLQSVNNHVNHVTLQQLPDPPHHPKLRQYFHAACKLERQQNKTTWQHPVTPLFMRSMELTCYMYVWNHYHLVALPWDSAWTWGLAFLAVDFGYYWVHRFSHGKPPADRSARARHGPPPLTRRSPDAGVRSSRFTRNLNSHEKPGSGQVGSGCPPSRLRCALVFLERTRMVEVVGAGGGVWGEVAFIWAAHQVHHSSEYYNLFTALRQSLTQQFTSWVFYLPMALAVPPSVFAVHIEFNLLYQFWIHTEVIRDLGPLEWILNTPSHHRVHHGRNLYCIDKNYGGVLIIWDRLFGTFAPEKDKVVYGLVFPIKTFEILYVQLSLATRVYLLVHFLLVLGLYFKVKMMLHQLTVLAMIGYMLLSFTSLGFIIDRRPSAAILEMLRCGVILAMQRSGYMEPLLPSLAVPTQAVMEALLRQAQG